MNAIVKIGEKRISNVVFFLTAWFSKWPTTYSLFVRNSGILSLDKIYFQGCHWSIHSTNYITALSLVKTMYGYPKREKKSGLRTKIKSFHSGYSELGLKVIHSKVPSSFDRNSTFLTKQICSDQISYSTGRGNAGTWKYKFAIQCVIF